MTTTKKELHELVDHINELLATPADARYKLTHIMTGYRLEIVGRDVSPRMRPSDMNRWLYAYIAGIRAAQGATKK